MSDANIFLMTWTYNFQNSRKYTNYREGLCFTIFTYFPMKRTTKFKDNFIAMKNNLMLRASPIKHDKKLVIEGSVKIAIDNTDL